MSLSSFGRGGSMKHLSSLVDPEWEVLDPNPDIIALFLQFDDRFFDGKLKAVVVKWSPRMTICAGLCRYEGRSGMCSISLSIPLLKLRPRKDLVETLLHEMIHAYLFVTNNNRDRDGHGPEFQYHMNRINMETGTNITIYHTFHEEVRLYKTHWWKCDGPCQLWPPFHGMVKRSMNRAPGPNDNWWAQHKATCGGSFVKVKEPEGFGVKKKKIDSNEPTKEAKKAKIEPPAPSSRDIRGFFGSPSKPVAGSSGVKTSPTNRGKTKSTGEVLRKPSAGPSGVAGGALRKPSAATTGDIRGFLNKGSGSTRGGVTANKGSSTVTIRAPSAASSSSSSDAKPTQGGVVSTPAANSDFVPFTGRGHVLGGGGKSSQKTVPLVDLDDSRDEDDVVACPVCSANVPAVRINTHLDVCLSK